MTEWQIDLIQKEHNQFSEVGTLNQFSQMEATQMILPFPLSKLAQDLERELEPDFSNDDNTVCNNFTSQQKSKHKTF